MYGQYRIPYAAMLVAANVMLWLIARNHENLKAVLLQITTGWHAPTGANNALLHGMSKRDRDDLLDVYKRKLEMTPPYRIGGEK